MPFLTIRRNTVAGDVVLAGIVLLIVLLLMAIALTTVWFPARPTTYVLTVIGAAAAWPLARRYPTATLVVTALLVAYPWPKPYIEPQVRLVPLALAGFRAAEHGVARRVVIPLVALATPLALAPSLITNLRPASPRGGIRNVQTWPDPSADLMMVVVLAVILALGYAVHRQRRIADDLHAQNAELRVLRAAEREHVAAEVRTAIARDIHDVVAHHVAAMVVTAQAADRVADRDPERPRAAVRAIALEGDEALAAMRRVVQVLRASAGPTEDRQPFEASMRDLVDRLRSSGRSVEVRGSLSATTEFVESAVLRIIQEALTNVMLHSRAELVTVDLSTRNGLLEVIVRDDGPSAAERDPVRTGYGVRGMVERASAVGGTVTAGPTVQGGWEVRAALPRSGSPVTA